MSFNSEEYLYYSERQQINYENEEKFKQMWQNIDFMDDWKPTQSRSITLVNRELDIHKQQLQMI